jgi:AcrR family transcriptional regulator
MSTQQLPRGAARDAIVTAATALFFENGYERTSVQEIVEAAQVTKGAFYHHFDAKEDLLLLIHDNFIEEGLRRVRDITASALSPAEKLDAVINEIVTDIARFQAQETIFFEQQRFLSEARFRHVKSKRDEYEHHVIGVLEEGIAAGVFRQLASTRVLAYGIIGMCSWTYRWYSPAGELSAEEISRVYSQALLDGLMR